MAAPQTDPIIQRMAVAIRQLYADAETRMMERVAKRLARGITEEGWTEIKLAEVRTVRREVDGLLQALDADARKMVADAITKSYDAGSESAMAELRSVLGKTVFKHVPNPHALQALMSETMGALTSTHARILRATQDVYRNVIAEVTQTVVTGVDTRIVAAQAALNRFANVGVTGFVDSAGRNWDLASYTEMAVRSSSMNAAIQGHMDRLEDNGRDLVIISNHGGSCEICADWEGKILSISGRSSQYPSLDEARDDGLFHPNCRHSANAYVAGLTRKPEIQPARAREEQYAASQQMRSNERAIRQWKRRDAVAITPDAAAQAQLKIKQYQAAQRDLAAAHDLPRQPARESIVAAH